MLRYLKNVNCYKLIAGMTSGQSCSYNVILCIIDILYLKSYVYLFIDYVHANFDDINTTIVIF